MFNLFSVTETLYLEENNSRLKEKVAEQQDTLQALGEDMKDFIFPSCYASYNVYIFQEPVELKPLP